MTIPLAAGPVADLRARRPGGGSGFIIPGFTPGPALSAASAQRRIPAAGLRLIDDPEFPRLVGRLATVSGAQLLQNVAHVGLDGCDGER